MEVLPSSGSVYSGLNSVEFIFYWRRILWRTTKEIWLSRYSPSWLWCWHPPIPVAQETLLWLGRSMGEVPDRETTNPNHRRLEKQRKKDSSESRAVSLDEKCRSCSFISVCCIQRKSWGAMWHRASGQFFHGFGFLGVWSRVGLSWFSRFFAWFHGFKNPFCAWDFCTFHRSKELFQQHAFPDCIIGTRDNDAVGCLRLLARKNPGKIRRGQKQKANEAEAKN